MISLPPARGGNRTKFPWTGRWRGSKSGEFGYPSDSGTSVKEPAIALDRRPDVSFASFAGRRRADARLCDT
jgi:hypothetical protein